jgi:hypothetical protein
MNQSSVFSLIDPDLTPILEELRSREPIFHSERFGRTVEDWERATTPGYWEVGASGRRYSREFILRMRSRIAETDSACWKVSGFGLRRLGPDCYLLTYTLDQNGRITRRATIWEKRDDWRLVYHQGTVVTAQEDDVLPIAQEQVPGG